MPALRQDLAHQMPPSSFVRGRSWAISDRVKNLNFFFSGSRSDEGCAMAADLADAKAGDILYSQYEGEHQVHF